MLANLSPASEPTAPAPWARLRRSLWLLPLLASLLFVAGVLAWAYRADRDEREDRRATMITDALSSEAQLRGLQDVENAHLKELARQLPGRERSAMGLATSPEVIEGLRRIWLSVTWLDANNRILAHVPDQNALAGVLPGELAEGPGLSAHLTQPMGADPRETGPLAGALEITCCKMQLGRDQPPTEAVGPVRRRGRGDGQLGQLGGGVDGAA